jgi:C-terminal processing protease CtpA/Prc
MQSIIPLPDGSRLKLTIARYYRPSGKAIHELGVQPTISIRVKPGERPLPPASALSAPATAVQAPKTLPGWAKADSALLRAYAQLSKP